MNEFERKLREREEEKVRQRRQNISEQAKTAKDLREKQRRDSEREQRRRDRIHRKHIKPFQPSINKMLDALGNHTWGRRRFGKELKIYYHDDQTATLDYIIGIYSFSQSYGRRKIIAINSRAEKKQRKYQGISDVEKHYFEVTQRIPSNLNERSTFHVNGTTGGRVYTMDDLTEQLLTAVPSVNTNPFNVDRSL